MRSPEGFAFFLIALIAVMLAMANTVIRPDSRFVSADNLDKIRIEARETARDAVEREWQKRTIGTMSCKDWDEKNTGSVECDGSISYSLRCERKIPHGCKIVKIK